MILHEHEGDDLRQSTLRGGEHERRRRSRGSDRGADRKAVHDATERGEVAFSREAPLFASLSATLVALIFVIPGRAESLLSALIGVIDDPAGWRIERGEDILALAGPVIIASARFLLPTVILLIAAGVLASVAQSAPRIVPSESCPTPRVSRRAKGFAGCWAPGAGPNS